MVFEEREELRPRMIPKIAGMSANCLVRRDVALTIGGFDELLGTGCRLKSGEEFDLQWRLSRAGVTTVLDPSLKVVHHGFRSAQEWPHLFWRDGIGTGAFLAKHLRCLDPGALLFAAKFVSREYARAVKAILLRRQFSRTRFALALIVGGVRSCRVQVDRRSRMYVETEP